MTAPPGLKANRAHVSVRVLGEFALLVGEQQIQLPTQAQRVVSYLAVSQTRSRRESLAGLLWPYSSQHRAQANLRTAIWRINQVSSRLIVTSRDLVWLRNEVDVDAHTAARVSRELIVTSFDDRPTPAVLGLLESDLLPGWDEDWLVVERERLRQLRMHALEALSRHLVNQDRYSEAIEAALSAVAAEPLRESAHAALIEAYVAEGNISEAARELESYRDLLETELGIQPSSRLIALIVPRPQA